MIPNKMKPKIKEIRRGIRKTLKRIFNRKTMTKAVVVLVSIALLATYILPYVLQASY